MERIEKVDGEDIVTLRQKTSAGDRDAGVAAVNKSDPALAARYPVKLSGAWPN